MVNLCTIESSLHYDKSRIAVLNNKLTSSNESSFDSRNDC